MFFTQPTVLTVGYREQRMYETILMVLNKLNALTKVKKRGYIRHF